MGGGVTDGDLVSRIGAGRRGVIQDSGGIGAAVAIEAAESAEVSGDGGGACSVCDDPRASRRLRQRERFVEVKRRI